MTRVDVDIENTLRWNILNRYADASESYHAYTETGTCRKTELRLKRYMDRLFNLLESKLMITYEETE